MVSTTDTPARRASYDGPSTPLLERKLRDRIAWAIGRQKSQFDLFRQIGQKLAEIDENLQRCRLTKLEEAEAHKRRKEIYEALHPQTKHGGDRKSKVAKSSGKVCHLKSYAEDAAEKTGKKARTVRLRVALAERIPDDVRRIFDRGRSTRSS